MRSNPFTLIPRYTPLRRTALERKPRPPSILSDVNFYEFIHTKPCIVCGKYGVEAHHAGDHGFGQRPPNRTCVPLCAAHHRTGPFAIHGPIGRNFWEYHGLDRDALIEQFNREFEKL